jgi:hypothetical protein
VLAAAALPVLTPARFAIAAKASTGRLSTDPFWQPRSLQGNSIALSVRCGRSRMTLMKFFCIMRPMSRTLIIVGLLIAAIGVLWPWLSRLGLGRLPGDIVIERENFTLYAPIGTGLLVSLVLSLMFWLFNR